MGSEHASSGVTKNFYLSQPKQNNIQVNNFGTWSSCTKHRTTFRNHKSTFENFASNRVNLQIFGIKAEIWLQKPTLPVTHIHLLPKTSSLTIHKTSFNKCEGWFFRKLWQHLASNKNNANHWPLLFHEYTHLQEMFLLSQWSRNRMTVLICYEFSKSCDVLIHFCFDEHRHFG